MPAAIDYNALVGRSFGRWTVVEYLGRIDGRAVAKCECSCENHTIKNVRVDRLLSGRSNSCGCLKSEIKSEQFRKMNYRHGMYGTKINNIWKSMIRRCNPNNSNLVGWENYGGRGIRVCDKWRGSDGFINFYNWVIKNGYEDGLSIERINVDDNYCPENCKWITPLEQSYNRRTSIYATYTDLMHEYDKEKTFYTFSLPVWSKLSGVNSELIARRLRNQNWSYTINQILLMNSEPQRNGHIKSIDFVITPEFAKRYDHPEHYDESFHD